MVNMRKTLIFMIGVLIVTMTACTGSDTIPDDWPAPDEMLKNLQDKGYTITEFNKVNSAQCFLRAEFAFSD